MSDNLIEDLRKIFEITNYTRLEFKELYGLTFVAQSRIDVMKGNVSSASIKPLGIIYQENGEYYFIALGEVQNIPGIVREYVKNCIDK